MVCFCSKVEVNMLGQVSNASKFITSLLSILIWKKILKPLGYCTYENWFIIIKVWVVDSVFLLDHIIFHYLPMMIIILINICILNMIFEMHPCGILVEECSMVGTTQPVTTSSTDFSFQVWTHCKIGDLNMWTLFCNVCIKFLNSQIWKEIMLELNGKPSNVTTFSPWHINRISMVLLVWQEACLFVWWWFCPSV
jgi:hypothetical protein